MRRRVLTLSQLVGALPSNPLRDIQAPRPSKPRLVEIALPDVLRIVENAPAPYPALFALLYGAGVEVSAALACVDTDVDHARREVRARGTKAHTRDRVVRVAEWAWGFVERHLDERDRWERIAAQNDEKNTPVGYRGGYLSGGSRNGKDAQVVGLTRLQE